MRPHSPFPVRAAAFVVAVFSAVTFFAGEASATVSYCFCFYPDDYSVTACQGMPTVPTSGGVTVPEGEEATCNANCIASGFDPGSIESGPDDQCVFKASGTGKVDKCGYPTNPDANICGAYLPVQESTTSYCSCRYRTTGDVLAACRGKPTFPTKDEGLVPKGDTDACRTACASEGKEYLGISDSLDTYCSFAQTTVEAKTTGCASPLNPTSVDCRNYVQEAGAGEKQEPYNVCTCKKDYDEGAKAWKAVTKLDIDAMNSIEAFLQCKEKCGPSYDSYEVSFDSKGCYPGTRCLKNPLQVKTFPELIGRILNVALGTVGSFALLMFIYGGFLWLTSAGSADKIGRGKGIMTWAGLGLILIFASYALIRFVLGAFTKL